MLLRRLMRPFSIFTLFISRISQANAASEFNTDIMSYISNASAAPWHGFAAVHRPVNSGLRSN